MVNSAGTHGTKSWVVGRFPSGEVSLDTSFACDAQALIVNPSEIQDLRDVHVYC